MLFKNSHARWSLPAAWAPDIRELAQTYARSNATSSGGTASGASHSSSSHHGSSHHSAHRTSSASSVMSDISDGLEMTQKVVKTVGAVASTAHIVAGVASGAAVGCTIM